MAQLLANNASTTLQAAITAASASLTVAAGTGALFPAPTGAADFFYCTLENAAGTIREVVKVTARAADVLTIIRAQDGTTATAFAIGDRVEARVTRAGLLDIVHDGQHGECYLEAECAGTWATTINTVNFSSLVVYGGAAPYVGMPVFGAGVPAGATIATYNASTGAGTISANFTATNAAGTPFSGRLKLERIGPGHLVINGRSETIPQAGVFLAPTGIIGYYTATQYSRTTNVVTLTFAAHGFVVGDRISVFSFGIANADMNGSFVITAVTATTIQYTAPGANITATAGTIYVYRATYIYAAMVAGVMTLEASNVGYAQDATTGVTVKSTDATRTLVGLVMMAANGTTAQCFYDTGQVRFVRSYFNRWKEDAAYLVFTGATTTTAGAWVEIAPLVFILAFADDLYHCQVWAQGMYKNAATGLGYVAVGPRTVLGGVASVAGTSAAATAYLPVYVGILPRPVPAEGAMCIGIQLYQAAAGTWGIAAGEVSVALRAGG